MDTMISLKASSQPHVASVPPDRTSTPIVFPSLTDKSSISALPSFFFQVDELCQVMEVEKIFRAKPDLPGVIITGDGGVKGMISRVRFFEMLGTRYGVAVYAKRPIHLMMNKVTAPTILSANCPIHDAVRLALERNSEDVYEPVLVEETHRQYRLLDIYTLLLAQSQLFAKLQHELRQVNTELERRVERRTAALAEANALLNGEIAERKEIEQNLHVRIRYEEALSRCADSLLTAMDDRDAVAESLDILLKATGVSRAFMAVLVQDAVLGSCLQLNYQVVSASARPISQSLSLLPLAKLEGWGDALRQGQSLVAHVDEVPGGLRDLLDALEIKSVLLLPVGKLDGWMGAIGLDETAVKRVWQEDDVQLMQTIARMLNTYIERQQSQEALAQAHDAALAASRFKSELLAKVSHELRTPLSAIKGYAQLLQLGSYGTLSTQQAEPIKLIISSTNFLTLLVNELLDQARLESNKLVLHDQIFSLRQMVADVEARMRVLAEHKGLLFASWIDPTLPEELVGDVTRLQQILTNLISNAIKFTQTGFVRVRIQAIWPDEWLLQVIDSGSGIPEEAHQTIFEPFGQVDGSATRLHSGTGLGLTISQQLAQLMGGTLILENTSGEGSIFSLRLPLRQFEYNVE
jgi:signal transduction histidine kinase